VLDSRRLNLELARLEGQRRAAEAIVDARAAELDQDERDRDALKRLSQERASNPKELADAESQVVIAQARLEEARRDLEVLTAQVDLVQTKIDDTTITAPFAGVVVSKKTEVGQWLGTGGIVAEVVANEAYDAWLDVPQEFAEYLLSRDAEVQLRIDATGETFRASDLRIVPLVDPMARTFNVYIRLVNDERRLAAGMSLTGWVPTGERQEYLTVPSDALLRNDAGFFVYVARVQPEGPAIAAPAQVDVLFETDGHVAVRGGSLRGGDRVVTEGNERLFPMTPISFELVDTPQSAADPGA
jgi:RND family efflux transporter MFP subunit